MACLLTVAVGCGGEGTAPAGPPEAALDSLNRGVLIRGGTFLTGSPGRREARFPGDPYSRIHEVERTRTVESFWIQEHEVTNREYARFDPGHRYSPERARHPVVEVTWREAQAYAAWLGGDLPDEVQWEFAARGEERRTYPWGEAEPDCDRVHFLGCAPEGTAEVMGRPRGATPEQVHDLAGNVREWVRPIWWEAGRHPVNREVRRLKGGSFEHPPFFLRAAAVTRDMEDDYAWDNIGFRVAWSRGG